MPLECYGYLRVSGRDQIDGDGFPRQCEAIERWAERNDATVKAVYLERAVSGKRGLADDEVDRPAFSEMVSAILTNGVRTVIVECLDRFARNMMVQTQLIAYLRSKEIRLISAATGDDVTAFDGDSDPMRWAMVQMQGVFAELERNMIVRKLRLARERKRRETGMCEGSRPFGLDPKRPNEPPIRDRIIALRQDRQSLNAIADTLNAEGLYTRQGKPWTFRTVSKVVAKHKKLETVRCQ